MMMMMTIGEELLFWSFQDKFTVSCCCFLHHHIMNNWIQWGFHTFAIPKKWTMISKIFSLILRYCDITSSSCSCSSDLSDNFIVFYRQRRHESMLLPSAWSWIPGLVLATFVFIRTCDSVPFDHEQLLSSMFNWVWSYILQSDQGMHLTFKEETGLPSVRGAETVKMVDVKKSIVTAMIRSRCNETWFHTYQANCSKQKGPNCNKQKGPNCSEQKGPNCNKQKGPNCSEQKGPNCSKQKGPNCNKQKGPNCNKQKGPNCNKQKGPNCNKQKGPNCSEQKGPNCNKQKGPNCNKQKGPELQEELDEMRATDPPIRLCIFLPPRYHLLMRFMLATLVNLQHANWQQGTTSRCWSSLWWASWWPERKLKFFLGEQEQPLPRMALDHQQPKSQKKKKKKSKGTEEKAEKRENSNNSDFLNIRSCVCFFFPKKGKCSCFHIQQTFFLFFFNICVLIFLWFVKISATTRLSFFLLLYDFFSSCASFFSFHKINSWEHITRAIQNLEVGWKLPQQKDLEVWGYVSKEFPIKKNTPFSFFFDDWMIFEFLSALFCWVKSSLEQKYPHKYGLTFNRERWLFFFFFCAKKVFACFSVLDFLEVINLSRWIGTKRNHLRPIEF